jgi:eukaryotic-like serine/threonine-protein kinase
LGSKIDKRAEGEQDEAADLEAERWPATRRVLDGAKTLPQAFLPPEIRKRPDDVDSIPATVRKAMPLRLPGFVPEIRRKAAAPEAPPGPSLSGLPWRGPSQEKEPPARPRGTPVPDPAKHGPGGSRFFSHDDDARWLDRYELICEIASGGMATVFLARLRGAGGFQRLVAIKLLHPDLASDPKFVDMFLAEARIAAQIHHAHVVPIVEIGSSDRGYYLVMEYIEGVTLAQLNQRVAMSELPVPRRIALRVVLDALAGLHAAHELTDETGKPLGLVHRDCSPQNIIIGVDGAARLMDFGVARATTRLSNTQTGTLKGKVAYMAPEQIKQGRLDRRADLFAMGVILWECLAGRTLFRAESKIDIILDALNAPVPRLSEVTAGVPPELEAVCVKALSRVREERFNTAVEMAEAIEQGGREAIATSREVESFLVKLFGRDFNERRTAIRAWIDERARKPPVSSPILARPKLAGARSLPASKVSPPSSGGQTRQLVGSLRPIQLDGEEPPAPSRPALFSSIGPPPTKRRPLGAALVVGAIAAAVTVGVMFWLNRSPPSVVTPPTSTLPPAPSLASAPTPSTSAAPLLSPSGSSFGPRPPPSPGMLAPDR